MRDFLGFVSRRPILGLLSLSLVFMGCAGAEGPEAAKTAESVDTSGPIASASAPPSRIAGALAKSEGPLPTSNDKNLAEKPGSAEA